MKFLKYTLLLFILVLLTNCQSLGSVLQEPKLSLNSVDLSKITFNGIDLIAHLNVENPNGFSIPLPKIDWELFINTASFVNGVITNDKTIKSRSTSTLDIPLSFTYEGLYNTISSLITTKEADFEIALGVSFPIPLIENKVYELNFKGAIPLPQLPKLSPGDIKISKIDFSGVELACGINVENPNKFPIPFPNLNWGYDVNGVQLFKSTFTGTGEIAAGTAGAALINVGISYADLFSAISSLRNSGEANGNLALDTGLDMPFLGNAKSLLEVPGKIPILQMPEVSFKGISKKSLGTTMEFILNWEIDNKNTFDFNIDDFIYNFKVNNNAWAEGKINNPPNLKAGGKTEIPLAVSISAVSIVMELVDIINRGSSVAYNCTGNVNLSSSFPGLSKLQLPLNLEGNTRIQ